MVGAISYFGVLDPSSYVGDRCDAPAGFLCKDFIIGENAANFLLANVLGRNIEVSGATFVSDDGTQTSCFASGNVRNEGEFYVECGSLASARGELIVSYRHADRATLDNLRTANFRILGSIDSGQVVAFSAPTCEYPDSEGVGGLNPCIEQSPVLTNVFSVSSWEETNNPGPRKITIGSVSIPGVVYECRTAHASNINSRSWEPCDGASGTNPVHYIERDGNHLRGNYVTEVRFTVNGETSPVKRYEYYMWSYQGYTDNVYGRGNAHSMATVCTNAEDHDAFFDAALNYIQKRGTFGSSTDLQGPRMRIAWTNQAGFTSTVSFASLKKEFHFNDDEQLILFKRRYPSVIRDSCTLRFSPNSRRLQSSSMHDCDAIVFNNRGESVCLARQGGSITMRSFNSNLLNFFWETHNHNSGAMSYFSRKVTQQQASSGNWASQGFRTDAFGNRVHVYHPDSPRMFTIALVD